MSLREIIIKKDYALVPLTKNRFAIIDLEDAPVISKYTWCISRVKGYACASEKGKKIYMHSFILNPPKNTKINFIDGNPLNCRKINLRKCSTAERNRTQPGWGESSSIYKGVGWHKKRKKWYAQITFNYKKIDILLDSSEFLCAQAYDIAALYYFKEFVYLNFSDKKDWYLKIIDSMRNNETIKDCIRRVIKGKYYEKL